jgi:hypothetical protein
MFSASPVVIRLAFHMLKAVLIIAALLFVS